MKKESSKLTALATMLLLGALTMLASSTCATEEQTMLRGDVEEALQPIENAFRAAPDDVEARRAYAEILFKLGNAWEAGDVIAPLGTTSSTDAGDLQLAARTALLTSDYDRAEALFGRLAEVAEEGSQARIAAIRGLTMVYYQTDQYAKSRELPTPEEDEGASALLTFMQRFAGTPYEIEWATPERVTHIAMNNDITQPGALPLVTMEVDGHGVDLILDTGGDRLFIDKDVFERIGIRTIAERKARYAYTGGETVDEPLGVAESVTMGDVTLSNVPVVGATWKALGQTSDGVLTTQILKQFLSTVDYDNLRITFRERGENGLAELMGTFAEEPVRMPFFMNATHLMFAKGSLNGHEGMNYFMDSGLAMSMPIVIVDETVEFLGLDKNPIDGTDYYWSPVQSHGLAGLVRGESQAIGNVFVEEDFFWRFGFMVDALMSHQYLRHLGSWTIDFDNMSYYFPDRAPES